MFVSVVVVAVAAIVVVVVAFQTVKAKYLRWNKWMSRTQMSNELKRTLFLSPPANKLTFKIVSKLSKIVFFVAAKLRNSIDRKVLFIIFFFFFSFRLTSG